MTLRRTLPSDSTISDASSFAVLTACVGARIALDVAESALAKLIAWSGAVDAIGGALAREEEEASSWVR